jgi:hypothetical protein
MLECQTLLKISRPSVGKWNFMTRGALPAWRVGAKLNCAGKHGQPGEHLRSGLNDGQNGQVRWNG